MTSPLERRARLALSAGLALYALRIRATPDTFRLLDRLDLAIHETGHLAFAWSGDVVTALGGTLFQLLVPLVFAWYFWRRSDRHAATVPLWWAGQNVFNIARYVADARAQDLPLVGGGEHDWHFLLTSWGVLEQDLQIAGVLRSVATLTTLSACVLGWLALRRPPWRTPEPIEG